MMSQGPPMVTIDADTQIRLVEVQVSDEVLLKMAECPTCSALVLSDGLINHLHWHRSQAYGLALG